MTINSFVGRVILLPLALVANSVLLFADCPEAVSIALKKGELTCEALRVKDPAHFQLCCPDHSIVSHAIQIKQEAEKKASSTAFQPNCDAPYPRSNSVWDPEIIRAYQRGDESHYIKPGENSKNSCERNKHFHHSFYKYVAEELDQWTDYYSKLNKSGEVTQGLSLYLRHCCVFDTAATESTDKRLFPAIEKQKESYFYRDSSGRQWTLNEMVSKISESDFKMTREDLTQKLTQELNVRFGRYAGTTPDPTRQLVLGLLREVLGTIDPQFNLNFLKDIAVICNPEGDVVSVGVSYSDANHPHDQYIPNIASRPPKGLPGINKGSGTGGGRSILKEFILKSLSEGRDGRIRLHSLNNDSTAFYRHMKMTCEDTIPHGANCYYADIKTILKVFPELGLKN